MINKIFSLCYDNAFYWVRFATLENQVCRRHNIGLSKLGPSLVPGNGSCLLANRFCYSLFYKLIFKLAERLRIPYIFDIDDLYWELPAESVDLASNCPKYRNFIDERLKNARLVTTTNTYLEQKLKERFPDIQVKVVPNAVPNWYAPKGGVVIANSDAFKLAGDESSWFSGLLLELFEKNIPVQFIGSNKGALSIDDELKFYFINNVSYPDYLSLLNSRGFEYGLIPVTDSNYASAKSDIKLQEFRLSGIKTFVSDILPYKRYGGCRDVQLVTNTESDWKKCFQEIIENSSRSGVDLNQHYQDRLSQAEAWEEAVKMLPAEDNRIRYFILALFMAIYLGYVVRFRDFLRSLINPVLKLFKN